MLNRIVSVLIVFFTVVCFAVPVFAEPVKTLSAGVSLNAQVPPALMGTWRVASVLKDTDSPANFKKSGVDVWNLSKSSDVITLSNPFTGATASISVKYVNKNTVRFSKEGNYDNQKLTDTVEITIEGDKFTGVNTLKLEDFEGGVAMKVRNATYVLRGEKISGTSVLGK